MKEMGTVVAQMEGSKVKEVRVNSIGEKIEEDGWTKRGVYQ